MRGSKVLDQSRQWSKFESDVSPHHYLRYLLAASLAKGRTLDAACGGGYGTAMLHRKTGDVVGVDYDLEAIEWATTYFEGPAFLHSKIEDSPWSGKFETVVSLETIEHVPDPAPLLSALRQACDGVFIASVPNEDVYPFKAENFKNDRSPHFRHYRPQEFDDLLKAHGFRVESRFCQKHKKQPEVVDGTDGMFLIYACS